MVLKSDGVAGLVKYSFLLEGVADPLVAEEIAKQAVGIPITDGKGIQIGAIRTARVVADEEPLLIEVTGQITDQAAWDRLDLSGAGGRGPASIERNDK